MAETTFEIWMKEVNLYVIKLCGLSMHDLADVCYRDWYDDTVSPATAARRAVKYSREG
jgi:hypothetical protein